MSFSEWNINIPCDILIEKLVHKFGIEDCFIFQNVFFAPHYKSNRRVSSGQYSKKNDNKRFAELQLNCGSAVTLELC